MKRSFFVRSMLTAGLPFVLFYAFVSVLCVEILRAFKYAWLEVRIEFSSYCKLMREKL